MLPADGDKKLRGSLGQRATTTTIQDDEKAASGCAVKAPLQFLCRYGSGERLARSVRAGQSEAASVFYAVATKIENEDVVRLLRRR